MMDLTGEEHVRVEAAQREAAERELFLEDLRRTFATPHGKRVLQWILASCMVHDSVFTGNSRTFHNSGRQDFGNELLRRVNESDLEIYISILRDSAQPQRS